MMVAGHVDRELCQGSGKWGGGERGGNAGEKNFFFPCLCTFREGRKSTMLFQMTPFVLFFLLNNT